MKPKQPLRGSLATTSSADAQEVPLGGLIRHRQFQPRVALDSHHLDSYEASYREGGGDALPPIKVARIKEGDDKGRKPASIDAFDVEALVVIDGFHRVTAAERAGLRTLPTIIIECTPRQAKWEAAKANMAHGVPLKRADMKGVMEAYITARAYKTPDGMGYKSYREMERDLCHKVSHMTIYRHIKKHHPRLAARINGAPAAGEHRQSPSDQREPMADIVDEFMANAQEVAKAATAMSPALRGDLLQSLLSLEATLKGLGVEEPDF